jgi:hypothetical protein
MKEHSELFRALKTKAIARVRVTAADVKEVKGWFSGFRTWCVKRGIQPRDVLNFDKARFRVSVALGEEIVVPAYAKKVSTLFKVVKVILIVLLLLLLTLHCLSLKLCEPLIKGSNTKENLAIFIVG